MTRFRVVVNGVEFVRDWPWERVVEVKDRLKALGFRWDPVERRWVGQVYSASAIAELARLLELGAEDLTRLVDSAPNLLGAVMVDGDVSGELSGHVLYDAGGVKVLSLSGVARNLIKRIPPPSQSFEEAVGHVLRRVKELVAGLRIVGDLDSALSGVREVLLGDSRLRELYKRRVEWWSVSLGPTSAKLNFCSGELVERLSSIRIPYNEVARDGSVVQRELRVVRVRRGGNGCVVEYPIAFRDRVASILREFGYLVRLVDGQYRRVSYSPRFRLLSFQEEAVERWVASGMRGTVVMPTGSGKSFVGLAAIARAGVSTIVFATTRELAEQWVRRIREFLGVSPGLLGGGEQQVRDVTVVTYASAVRHVDELIGRFGLAVFDEAHHVPAETFKEVALRLDSPMRLALSATPEREDGNEHLIYEAVGPVVYATTYSELVRYGLVVPVRHYRVFVELGQDEVTRYRAVAVGSGNVILLRNVAAQASAKIPVAGRIAEFEASLGSKVLVFTQFVEQARAVYELLRGRVRAELVTSETSDSHRARAFRLFADGSVRVLVTTTVLDEGIDVPDANVAVIVSGTGSRRQMIQRIGRVVRATQDKYEARVYELVTKNTVEEALSESRHFSDYVVEEECRDVPASRLEPLLRLVESRLAKPVKK